jgi:large repetitive protein
VFKFARRTLLACATLFVGVGGIAVGTAHANHALGIGNLFISSSLSAPDTLLIGQTYFFDVTLKNQAPTNPIVDGATLTSTLNPLLPITSVVVLSNPTNATVDCSATSGQNVKCEINNLGVDATVTMRVTGTVSLSASPTQEMDFDWKIVSPQEPGAKRSLVTYPVDPAKTDLQVIVGSASTPVGGTGSLAVTVKNLSAYGTYSTVTTRVTFGGLPTGLTLTPPASCSGTAPTFDCVTSGQIAANSQAVFSFGTAATAAAASSSVAVTGAIQASVTINDSIVANNTAAGTINVGPAAIADTFSTRFGVVSTGSVRQNDSASGSATFTLLAGAAHGTVTIGTNGSYEYNPAAGFSGTDSFTYTVTDPSGMTSTATVTMRVGPQALNDTATTPAGAAVSGTVATNDFGAAGAVWSGPTAGPAHGTVVIGPSGTYTYTPAAGFSGTDSFTYTVTNPDGSTATATMQVAVGPIAVNDNVAVAFDRPFNGSVSLNDAFVTGATFTRGTGPSHGTLTMNADGTYVYRPTAGYSGPDSFTYTVTNPAGGTSTATVNVNVGGKVADDSFETSAGKSVSGDVSSNDRIASGGIYSKATSPSKGTAVMNSNGTVTYQPNAGFSGTDSFTYEVLNTDGTTSTATVTIRVGPKVVDSTVLATGSATGIANQSGTSAPGAVCSLATKPAHGTVVLKPDCSYVYTADAGYTGQDEFVYNVTNPDGLTSAGTITLNVRAAGAAARLPETGSDPRGTLAAGAAFLAVGLILLPFGRRRANVAGA